MRSALTSPPLWRRDQGKTTHSAPAPAADLRPSLGRQTTTRRRPQSLAGDGSGRWSPAPLNRPPTPTGNHPQSGERDLSVGGPRDCRAGSDRPFGRDASEVSQRAGSSSPARGALSQKRGLTRRGEQATVTMMHRRLTMAVGIGEAREAPAAGGAADNEKHRVVYRSHAWQEQFDAAAPRASAGHDLDRADRTGHQRPRRHSASVGGLLPLIRRLHDLHAREAGLRGHLSRGNRKCGPRPGSRRT
jgi:hypothetical protein